MVLNYYSSLLDIEDVEHLKLTRYLQYVAGARVVCRISLQISKGRNTDPTGKFHMFCFWQMYCSYVKSNLFFSVWNNFKILDT